MIKRYMWSFAEKFGQGLFVSDKGDYVKYDDYAALQQKLDALAAENAALKEFGDKMNDMHNNLNGEGTGIQGRAEVACQQAALEAAIEEFDTIKTPATDTYLNSVRAEAVSNFWNSSLRDVAHVLKDIRAFDDSSEAAGIVHSEIKERVDDFVESLRSGTHDTADKAG